MNTPRLSEKEQQIIYRLVCRVVMADQRLDDSELEYLGQLYEKLGITDEDRRLVHETLDTTTPVTVLADSLSEKARRQLKDEMLDAAWADQSIHITEAKIIAEAVMDLLITDHT